jgi:hypothetical protein
MRPRTLRYPQRVNALALGRQLAFGRAAKRLGLHPPLAVLEGEADAHLCA